jgi:sarcosine oxidase subunit gamma
MSEPFQALDVAIRIERRTPPAMVTLRGDLAAPELAAAVAAVSGCAVPGVRRVEIVGGNVAAWMSPDELLLVLAPGAAPAAVAALGAALEGTHHLAVDVSDARAVFRLSGPGARAVLACGAPVDLAGFGAREIRRTRLGQVAAAFWMPEAEVFDLVCFGSVAGFVSDWLADAARPGHLPRLF